MENTKPQKRRGRRRSVSFDPNHNYVEKSVEEYLKGGGTIKRIERVNGSYESFVSISDTNGSADEFLMEG
ncbi:MAG: hypothetical protein HN745_15840 [Deltaproteobacteria bacterium]|nr:hypothetical protein [Deltaproteobacteria bacterium]